MAGRIVLFGATGYTGRLVAHALEKRGARPVLAARSREKLEQLASERGGLETQVADVSDPKSVRALVERGDVLVSTVGPFVRWGRPAVEAAVDAGAHYIDSTGEPPFIRAVFEEYGAAADKAGCGLLTAFGYDYVPGNLAGALALERAGEHAEKVSVGYFFTGRGSIKGAASGGTLASMGGVMLEPHFAFREGRVVTERPAKRVRSFDRNGRAMTGISIGSSEHFGLPRVHPSLREVDAYLGWFGPASRAVQAVSVTGDIPGMRSLANGLVTRFVKGSTGGPDAEARSKTGSWFPAEAADSGGNVLARAELSGPNGYTFTGDIMAWGAQRAASEGLEGTGALGPVEAFGLRVLEAGSADVGLKEAG
ncbi:MAG TPA: saccharopine dehydrogenase NADP-binding domain-containing protein [Thermoleophilaceae bacterium]